ncbi:MAG TPA: vitamin K epoxide reductase family protein [Acidimicrobiales bacterium]|nr:vitamin K epoxide reductase family protein [Acidimicrobiales bacterium]
MTRAPGAKPGETTTPAGAAHTGGSPAGRPPPAEVGTGALRVLGWAATGVALLGAAVAAYLTIAHLTTPAVLACSDTGAIDCARVTTSPQSVIAGVPVAILGLAYFVAMAGLNLPGAWSARGRLGAWAARLRLAGAVAGMGFVVYLVSAEVLVIGAICIYCTIVHVLAFTLFVLVVSGTARRGLGAATST